MSKESFNFNPSQEEAEPKASEVKKSVFKKAGVLAAIGAAGLALFAHEKNSENPKNIAENFDEKVDPIVAMIEGDVDSGTPEKPSPIIPNIKVEKVDEKTDGSLAWTVADKDDGSIPDKK